MSRYIEGQDRQQVTLLPECLDDFIAEDNPIRVVDAFVGDLYLAAMGFEGATPGVSRTVEHVFGTFKSWMGYTHFLTKRLANVGTEMSLHVLAYNLRRVVATLGFEGTIKAIRLAGV